ncbi:hypothetical protein OIDMADRAFT_50673 [Oidiodendron maius Zn]|uniref:HIT-type domain-containing protein n=1 Tax=Oidiodendron maius (strain Zn) TaxID=913774 RepID=A0A0C3D0R2_OIDMZ|nr:hypothetical protein OIDMADRAFT_50673 [Oidiodendron maius Zn]
MINFGVREVAISTVPVAPGWAYVPDTGSAASASQPSARKRMRTLPSASQHETTAKQDAKIMRELAALDRENHRDVSIPVPIRHRDNAGRASHGKVTPAVRKILQSQKTFANHLADYEALSAINASQPAQPNPPPPLTSGRATPTTAGPQPPVGTKRSYKKRESAATAPTPLRNVSTVGESSTPVVSKSESSHDTSMTDAPNTLLGTAVPPASHPEDNNPLLISRVPQMPSQEEIEKMLAAPALSYNEARGSLTAEDRRKPAKHFCDVCGYWGRVRCGRCGGRVCALECLALHQEECFTRYGA